MWCDSPFSVAAPPVLPSPVSLDSAESRGGQTPPWLIHGKAGVSEGIGGRKAWQTAHSRDKCPGFVLFAPFQFLFTAAAKEKEASAGKYISSKARPCPAALPADSFLSS